MKQMRFTYIYAIMWSIFLKLFKKFSKKLRPRKNAQTQNETLPRKHVYLLFFPILPHFLINTSSKPAFTI